MGNDYHGYPEKEEDYEGDAGSKARFLVDVWLTSKTNIWIWVIFPLHVTLLTFVLVAHGLSAANLPTAVNVVARCKTHIIATFFITLVSRR